MLVADELIFIFFCFGYNFHISPQFSVILSFLESLLSLVSNKTNFIIYG